MLDSIFTIIILILSAVIHEYMHGFAAFKLGDDTAKRQGRLTLNPIAHLDPIGSVALPLLLTFSGSPFFFAWAKPVPFNPYNLSDKKYGMAKVAAAGPLGNLLVAIIFAILIQIITFTGLNLENFLSLKLLASVVYINLTLMIFNLIPLPPLDGSKILLAFLPWRLQEKWLRLEQYGMIIIFILLFACFDFLQSIINLLFYKLVLPWF